MKPDPSPLARGGCARPSCKKPVPEAARGEGDPFCSSRCCRAYHGVVFKSDEARPGPGRLKVPGPCNRCGGPRDRTPKGKLRCGACDSYTQRKKRQRAAEARAAAKAAA